MPETITFRPAEVETDIEYLRDAWAGAAVRPTPSQVIREALRRAAETERRSEKKRKKS